VRREGVIDKLDNDGQMDPKRSKLLTLGVVQGYTSKKQLCQQEVTSRSGFFFDPFVASLVELDSAVFPN
jgi:hypothetical protein